MIFGGFYELHLGQSNLLTKIGAPFEKLLYKICCVDEKEEMGWKQYLFAVLFFNFIGFLFVFFTLMFQGLLPLNPAHMPNLSWRLSLNTAISFMAITNWQSYADHELKLTSTEYDLLKILLRNGEKLVPHRMILKEIWGPNSVEHTHYLRVYFGQLRKKLDSASVGAGEIIENESGVGYRLKPIA